MSRSLIITIGIVIVVIIALFLFSGIARRTPVPDPVKLTVWGFGDDQGAFDGAINQFHQQYQHVSISYRRFDEATYEQNLVNRLAEGKGPDIFLLKNSWLARNRDKLAALAPASAPFSPADFSAMFAPAASSLVADDGSILASPLSMDSLALFYNQDVFDAAGITVPPATWDAFTAISRRLTAIAPSGDITRSGAALGTAENIPHALELVSAMILQSGDPIARADGHVDLGSAAEQALQFYTSFASIGNQNFSWSPRMGSAFDAFAEGTSVMAFGFSDDIPRIQARNPHLRLGVAPLPQLGKGTPRTYGAYNFMAVSRSSANFATAWQFALYMSSPDGARLYAQGSGRPPVRRDLIASASQSITDPAGVFSRQALIARDWPIPDESATRRIFNDAIEGVASRTYTATQVLGRIRDKLQLLFP